jgi:hypothetical protein
MYCFIAALSLDRVKIREQVLAPAIGLFHPDQLTTPHKNLTMIA